MAGGFNGRVRLIDLPAGGGFSPVSATGPVRGWECRESVLTSTGAANTPQGFKVQIPNDGSVAGFATTFARPAPSVTNEPGEFPIWRERNLISEHAMVGEVIGGPGGAAGAGIGTLPATVLCNLASLTATATTIEFWEFD